MNYIHKLLMDNTIDENKYIEIMTKTSKKHKQLSKKKESIKQSKGKLMRTMKYGEQKNIIEELNIKIQYNFISREVKIIENKKREKTSDKQSGV